MSFKDKFNGMRNKFRKEDVNNNISDEEKQDQMLPEEEPNPFFAGNHDINLSEAEDPNKRGRRLKGKAVIGVAALVAAIGIGAIVSNMMSPKKPVNTAPPPRREQGNSNPATDMPSSYADLAKYRAEQAKAAKEKAEKERRAKEEAEKKKLEAAKAAEQGKEGEFKRTPTPPGAPTPPASAPSAPSAPANVPNYAEMRAKQEADRRAALDLEAKRSAVSFNVGGGASGAAEAAFGSYSGLGNRSNVDVEKPHVINAGSIIPATLINGLDTRMSGDVVAQVRQDVYDTLTGQHLLIPQGSRLIGTTTGGRGRRVGVKFDRIILPDGTSISLPSQQGVDKGGYAGLKDQYDTHESDFWRSALLSGVLSYVADEVDHHMGNRSGVDQNGNSYGSAVNDTVDKITAHLMNRADKGEPANAIIRPGFQFNVFLNKDFTAYEYRR